MVWALGASRLLEVRLLHALGTGGSVRGGHKRGQLHFCPYCVSIPVLVFVTRSCSLCRANAAACHDRRPRRDSEDPRSRRASGRARRPAPPVRPPGSASRAARAAGAPRRDPVGVSRARAPVEVCAASAPPARRSAGLTGPRAVTGSARDVRRFIRAVHELGSWWLVSENAVYVSYARFAPPALTTEPTEDRRRQLHVWNLMVRLLSEHLAGRLDLGAPEADLLKKRGQRVNALRSAERPRLSGLHQTRPGLAATAGWSPV